MLLSYINPVGRRMLSIPTIRLKGDATAVPSGLLFRLTLERHCERFNGYGSVGLSVCRSRLYLDHVDYKRLISKNRYAGAGRLFP